VVEQLEIGCGCFRRLVEIDFGPKALLLRFDGPSFCGLEFSEGDGVYSRAGLCHGSALARFGGLIHL